MMRNEIFILDSWEEYFRHFSTCFNDVYFKPEYSQLYSTPDAKSECLIIKNDRDIFLMPYLLKKIKINGFSNIYDIETPYGYGGFLTTNSSPEFTLTACKIMIKYFSDKNIIAGLIRHNPFHPSVSLFPNLVKERNVVIVNLESEESIWNNIHSKHKNVIRKAEENGLEFQIDESFRTLEEFKKIYKETLLRIGANNFYDFNDEYFESLSKNLNDWSFIANVKFQEKTISSAIFFKYREYSHYHLSGSLTNYQKYYPNNFLIYHTARYLLQNKIRHLNLGGGVSNADDDSLYKFKKRFSKIELPFFTSRLVFNKENYEAVCNKWLEDRPLDKQKYDNYLLKYRY